MSLTREQYLNTISPIRILRDYGSKGPQILTENEKNRLKEIEKESTKSAFSLKTAILYNEYQTLRIKEKGKWDFHTIFEIIGSFFDERNLKAFKYFSSFVPTETEGDQYGCWDRKLLGEYTLCISSSSSVIVINLSKNTLTLCLKISQSMPTITCLGLLIL